MHALHAPSIYLLGANLAWASGAPDVLLAKCMRREKLQERSLRYFRWLCCAGVVCDKGLTLGNLIGILKLFFDRLGLKKLQFKPAFNPYTEPSMEIFAYSEQLQKWIEVCSPTNPLFSSWRWSASL